MNITRIETFDEHELLTRLATTRLRGHGQPLIYANARLELVRKVDPATLFPAQRYVLDQDHHTIRDLYHAFQERGIDLFGLEGGVLFWRADPEAPGGEEGPIPFIPPIVEMSHEPDGRIVPLINDGMHRVYTAMKMGRTLNIVLVHDVPVEYPYYAHALSKGWDEVVALAELPDQFVKKSYRDPVQYKALFRDFNAVFDGIQKERKKTNPGELRPGAG
ncbi:MAG: hypothetical protein HQL84_13775 [Magnetococcales bacterium]|nr:hypothetical protein [Magnetococcales bacterium]MBF0151104.1 hypothetical protein [Magnetococcales bacterium]MBF0174020.1 hypothetical protein [Magnetococcales bacterium]MBF0346767.1 hypothetical protein [Magnetococcales bacterium]MBF0630986.1 hypothetical protein [Magnetococcales bacterium]